MCKLTAESEPSQRLGHGLRRWWVHREGTTLHHTFKPMPHYTDWVGSFRANVRPQYQPQANDDIIGLDVGPVIKPADKGWWTVPISVSCSKTLSPMLAKRASPGRQPLRSGPMEAHQRSLKLRLTQWCCKTTASDQNTGLSLRPNACQWQRRCRSWFWLDAEHNCCRQPHLIHDISKVGSWLPNNSNPYITQELRNNCVKH